MFSVKHPHKYFRQNKRLQQVNKSRKVKTLVKALSAAWKDFCTTSSFVLFRYIYRKNRTIFDIIFWILLTVTLMYWTIIFITGFLDRYHSLSTTTIVSSRQFPINRSPFPAVTACLSGRISKSLVRSFIDKYIFNNPELQGSIDVSRFLHIFSLKENSTIAVKDASRIFTEYNLTMRDVLNMTTEDCDEVLTKCRWAGEIIPCKNIFQRTMAVGGFCCSFNYPHEAHTLMTKKWLRSKDFGIKSGLSIAFKSIPNEDYYFKITYANTFRVILHSPFSYPMFNENDIITSLAMETAIQINAVVNSASENVRNLPLEDRDCAFRSEEKLKYSTMYSTSNCLIECRIDRVFDNCGCIEYYYPNENDQVCPPEKWLCATNHRQAGVNRGENSLYGNCDCPDDCVNIRYNVVINSWEISTNSNYAVDEFYDGMTRDHGIVHISYGKSTTMHLKRRLSFDEIQLASSIGGIAALFLGCSFISVVEVIYFLVIRVMKLYFKN